MSIRIIVATFLACLLGSAAAAQPLPRYDLERLEAAIEKGELGDIAALASTQGGKIVYRKRFDGKAPGTPVDIKSAGKSITALAVGMAIMDGKLAGRDVAVLCEGDPFFYGSFMHLHARLRDLVPVRVVPAITGMGAAWAATDAPITWGDDVLATLMGTLPEEVLVTQMQQADALVIMKIGRNIDKIRRALRRAGRFEAAWLVEYAAMPDQTVQRLSEAEERITPYFSIIIVHGQGRRP